VPRDGRDLTGESEQAVRFIFSNDFSSFKINCKSAASNVCKLNLIIWRISNLRAASAQLAIGRGSTEMRMQQKPTSASSLALERVACFVLLSEHAISFHLLSPAGPPA
jgi:hypothetical protein